MAKAPPRKPPACFEARTALISLREKAASNPAENYKVVFPADWSKSQLLAYVRAVHPLDAVKLLRWDSDLDRKGNPVIWMTNPRAFTNYKKGIGNWK